MFGAWTLVNERMCIQNNIVFSMDEYRMGAIPRKKGGHLIYLLLTGCCTRCQVVRECIRKQLLLARDYSDGEYVF